MGTALKVGVFWQGNPKHRWDCFRSFPLSRLAPLAAVPNVKLFSLQKGPGADQLQALGGRFPIIDLGSAFEDTDGAFTDAAAVLTQLDLVIGCDTALAHLAGALGQPAWVLLSTVCDWRWLCERTDSPWYPSLRLFRQRELNDWDEVIRRVVKALRRWRTEQRRTTHPPPARVNGQVRRAERRAELRAIDAEPRHVCAEARRCEQAGDVGPRFLELARSVFQIEERREQLQREINGLPPLSGASEENGPPSDGVSDGGRFGPGA